jgi:hypothetical protein
VESLGQLADKGLAVDDPERLAPQLLDANGYPPVCITQA